MNATELLCYLTDRQIDSLFRAARALPADKLDWKPEPGARSAMDQLKEVATAINQFWAAFEARKIEWDDSKFAAWQAERDRLTNLDDLEKECRVETKRLTDFIRERSESELDLPVEMPFPGEYKLGDILAYHLWNASYHEGQITYISTLLEKPAEA